MKWKKLGKIFENTPTITQKETSYAAFPIVRVIDDKRIKVIYSTRVNNRASPKYFIYNLIDHTVEKISDSFLLLPGDLGTFDDDGVIPTCEYQINNTDSYLYYVGWNRGVTVTFRNNVGLAISNDGGISYKKLFKGPILDRSAQEPHFVAGCCVLKEGSLWEAWYVSCVKWENEKKPKHYYHIKYATSADGINWLREGKVAIDFEEGEYAIAPPCVIKEDGKYKMWFSARGDFYQIFYAESLDGINFERKKEPILSSSEFGWDSGMAAYPHVFDHNGKRYMLYNGNGYGKTGMGLAILEQD